jgi:hypothetical protein
MPGQGGDLDAAVLAHEFADLEASLAGVAGGGHEGFLRSRQHDAAFRCVSLLMRNETWYTVRFDV